MATSDPLTTAREHIAAARYAQAEQVLTRHLSRAKHDTDATLLMAECSSSQRKWERALYYFDIVLERQPENVLAAMRKADTLFALMRDSEGADLLLPYVKKYPTDTALIVRTSRLLMDCGRLAECCQTLKTGLSYTPNDPGLLHAWGHYCHRIGDSVAAVEAYNAISQSVPDQASFRLSHCTSLNYHPGATLKDQYIAHAAYGRIVRRAARFEPFKHPPKDDPDRKVRVGLISPDFRIHSVSYFAEPIFDHLDRSKFSLHAYYTLDIADATTDRLRRKADSFLVAIRTDEHQIAQRIHDDKIDILIDLCGLFAGHVSNTLYLRPAPVQATYIGYPNTTGIPNMDYRIVDSITDPPTDEKYTTETLVRIDPCFLCYKPEPRFAMLPESAPTRDGVFTFASFNAATKLSDATLALWGRILVAAPEARLLIKSNGMEEEELRDHLRQRMTAAGVPIDRVDIMGRYPNPLEHFLRYLTVDLALDTYPYCGTTTTLEAMYMGVPVLTLTGATHASRVGASLLSAAGFPQLAAASADRYVETAVQFANDRASLAPLRQNLRARLLASPLCDGPAFGTRFNDLLSRMWRARCTGEVVNG